MSRSSFIEGSRFAQQKMTDHQVQKYKQHHPKLSQVASAAKAGISERSERRIEHREALPSQREERTWRTRADPLAPVWGSEIVTLLETDGALNAVTLLEELQRRYPGDYDTSSSSHRGIRWVV